MTLTSHDRKYLAIAMPAAMEGVFMNLLGMADLVMVGALGTLSIAAIGVFEQPRMVLLTVALSFASVIVFSWWHVMSGQEGSRKRERLFCTRRSSRCRFLLSCILQPFSS